MAQPDEENLGKELPEIIGEAVFAKNVLTNIAGFSPYNAVIGRQPKFLPPLEEGPSDSLQDRAAEIKAAKRLIQFATDAIVKETARQRLITADSH